MARLPSLSAKISLLRAIISDTGLSVEEFLKFLLYVVRAVARGREEVKAAQTVSHKQVAEELCLKRLVPSGR